MKKVMSAVLAVVLFVSLFGAIVVPVFANDSDNFAAAGKKILLEREQTLLLKKAAIDAFALKIASDGVATGEEMIDLNAMMDGFISAKFQADEYLEFYSLKTETVLNVELVKMTKDYYDGNFIFKRDKNNLAKKYLTSLTGQDIVVQKSGASIAGKEIVVMILIFIFLALFVAGILIFSKSAVYTGAAGFMIISGFGLFLIILLFFLFD